MSPRRRDEGKYCAFYNVNGHETSDYHHPKDQIEELIRNGYLTEFVMQEDKEYKEEKDGRTRLPQT